MTSPRPPGASPAPRGDHRLPASGRPDPTGAQRSPRPGRCLLYRDEWGGAEARTVLRRVRGTHGVHSRPKRTIQPRSGLSCIGSEGKPEPMGGESRRQGWQQGASSVRWSPRQAAPSRLPSRPLPPRETGPAAPLPLHAAPEPGRVEVVEELAAEPGRVLGRKVLVDPPPSHSLTGTS